MTTRETIERMNRDWQDKPVKPGDVIDNAGLVVSAIEYFRELDIEINGTQVAKLFDALLHDGRFPTDATDDAGLPEWPWWLL